MRRHALSRGALVAALILGAPPAGARSVLDGLELMEGEKGEGVEILALDAASPAARAKLRIGDRITAIGGAKVRNLDDYVTVSRRLKKGDAAAVEYWRDGLRHTAELSLRSSPLRERWGIAVVPWREKGGTPEKESAAYWLDRAREQMRENDRKGESASPADHGKAILSLFTALDADPEALGTAMMIGRRYGELAAVYRRGGETRKAVWCLRRALLIYGNSLQKADNLQDLALVRSGLGDLQRAVGKIQ